MQALSQLSYGPVYSAAGLGCLRVAVRYIRAAARSSPRDALFISFRRRRR